MKLKTLLSMGAMMALCACAGDNTSANDEQVSAAHQYKIIKVIYQEKEYLANDDAFIEFGADRVSGSSGCNRFFGSVHYDSDEISFENVGATRMYCHDYEFENVFFGALDKLSLAPHTSNSGEMMLYSSDRIIVLKPIK